MGLSRSVTNHAAGFSSKSNARYSASRDAHHQMFALDGKRQTGGGCRRSSTAENRPGSPCSPVFRRDLQREFAHQLVADNTEQSHLPDARGTFCQRVDKGCSPRAVGEQHAPVGRHCRLAARGMVGQDRHHITPDHAQLVAVVDPPGAIELAQTIQRPAHLMLRVDHVAACAQRLGLGDLAARAGRGGARFAPAM